MTMRALTRRLPLLTIVAVLTTVAAGCGSSPASSPASSGGASSGAAGSAGGAFPTTVMAADGAVHISKRPTAIISLSPTATEMLYATGAGHQVSAVDADSDYPPQAPRTKLSYFDPNLEGIVALKPDLVVISNNSGSLTKRLTALSVPVLELPAPANVSGVYAEFDQLGRATGDLTQAEREVTSLRSQISQIVAEVPNQSRPPPSWASCSGCSGCGVSPTPPKAPRPQAGIRNCLRNTSSRPTRTTSSWPTPSAAIRASRRCEAGRAGPGSRPSSPGTSSCSTTTSPRAGDRASSTCSGSCWRPCDVAAGDSGPAVRSPPAGPRWLDQL